MVKKSIPDIERFKRQNFPEAIYCPGKSISEIIKIAKQLKKHGSPVIATRATPEIYRALKRKFPQTKFHKSAEIVSIVSSSVVAELALQKRKLALQKRFVAVVTAGTADIPVAEESAVVLEILGNKAERIYDVGVAGVHRLFKHQQKLTNAICIIVCAGMEGALPSIVGGLVNCPVIGVPTSVGYGTNFKGISALLTMLNSCAANVCVVNIDDGFGAGIIAHLINQKL